MKCTFTYYQHNLRYLSHGRKVTGYGENLYAARRNAATIADVPPCCLYLESCAITHDPGKVDPRYSVTLEFCGHGVRPKYIARFCGEWLGQADEMPQAWNIAQEHKTARDARLNAVN